MRLHLWKVNGINLTMPPRYFRRRSPKRYAGIQIFLRIIQNSKQRPFAKSHWRYIGGIWYFQKYIKAWTFWYYLEESDIKPIVREEYKIPCSLIYQRNNHKLLFEVTYYRNRINLEVFHVLTDGTGAMNFLKTLVSNYLTLAENVEDSGVDYDASSTQKSDDRFFKIHIPAKFSFKSKEK